MARAWSVTGKLQRVADILQNSARDSPGRPFAPGRSLSALNLVPAKGERFVPHFEEPEGFPDYLAGRAVAAGLHLALHELFEFGSERDVHAVPGSVLSLRVPPPIQSCQCWTSPKSDPPYSSSTFST